MKMLVSRDYRVGTVSWSQTSLSSLAAEGVTSQVASSVHNDLAKLCASAEEYSKMLAGFPDAKTSKIRLRSRTTCRVNKNLRDFETKSDPEEHDHDVSAHK